MPIYEYRAVEPENGCEYCKEPFENFQKTTEAIEKCPKCGAPVQKIVSRFGVAYGMDYRAKSVGFQKLVKKDKGTYEKMYKY